jgi:60 kDa SS-A/Ro ribonucleoprotein
VLFLQHIAGAIKGRKHKVAIGSYTKSVNTKQTPQTEPIPGSAQVPNSAGGYSFKVDDWTRLQRFLILGTEGGSYYATERELTKDNAEAVIRCVRTDGPRAVKEIVEVSKSGRAPKNEPAIFALAIALKMGDEKTKIAAKAAVPDVCRIGTHIFAFGESVKALGGWGRGTKTAVSNWYTSQSAEALAHQLVKYQQRNGWSHADLLRKAHPQDPDAVRQGLFRYALKGMDGLAAHTVNVKRPGKADLVHDRQAIDISTLPPIIEAFERAKRLVSDVEVVRLIEEHGLPRECIPTNLLNSPDVWRALLTSGKGMPFTAMIRNLAKMTNVGLLRPLSTEAKYVMDRLSDKDGLKKARVHPLQILTALRVYSQGRGDKGSLEWTPVPQITDALNDAFYLAFDAIEPTGKRHMLSLDVSSSMTWSNIAGMNLTPRDGSAAMSLVTAAVEKQSLITAFASARGYGSYNAQSAKNVDGIMPLDISAKDRLDHVIQKITNLPAGGTDCSLPIRYAQANKLEVDVFQVYTDSETWAGPIHASQALKEYRQKTGIPAKLIVVGMVANEFSIADPNDAGMMDVVGFDTSAPSLMADFVRQ